MVVVGVNCKWGKHRSVSFAEDLADKLKDCPWLHEAVVLHLERTRWDYDWRRSFRVRANIGIPFPVPHQYLFMFHWRPTCPVERVLTLTP